MSEQRLIDANALCKKIKETPFYVWKDCERVFWEIITAPTIDPVRHGKWIVPTKIGGRSFNIPHCSVCDGVPCGVDENTKYCPHCGAKMDKED